MTVSPNWWQSFFQGVPLHLWRQVMTPEQNRAEADFIEKTLGLSAGARVLDVPCGHGRLTLELAGRGHHLTGVDYAEEEIAVARSASGERGLTIDWQRGDMRELRWENTFDGAFCVGNSFGYLDDEGNFAFLRGVGRALKPGARFLIDTGMAAESVIANYQERRWYKFGDIHFLIANRYDHVAGRLDTEYTFIRDGKVDVRMGTSRVFTYRELCDWLHDAGFGECQGFAPDGGPYRLGAHSLRLVATRK